MRLIHVTSGAVAVIAVWWLVCGVFNIPEYKLPSPPVVATTAWTFLREQSFYGTIGVSLFRLMISSVLGLGGGFLLGLLIGLSGRVSRLLGPTLSFFQAIAGITWIPVAIVWFGVGTPTVVFIVTNAVFFIMLYNTAASVDRVPSAWRESVMVLGGSRWAVLRYVILPGALVGIFSGLRTGLAFGWRALVVAEFLAASNGIGYLTLEASRYYESATVLVGVLTVGVIWLVVDRLGLRLVEKATIVRWGLARQ